MKKILLLSIVLAMALTSVTAQTIGDYRSTANTTLSVATGWETYNGASWVAATYPVAGNTLTIKAPSTWTSGQYTVTMNTSNSLVRVGQSVSSTGNIPGGTTITAISGNVLTLSNATIAGSGGTLSVFESTSASITASSGATTLNPASANLAVAPGMYVTGTGIAANTTVQTVSADGLTYTISPAASGAVSGSISFYTPATTINSASSGATSFTLVSANTLVTAGMTVYGSGISSGTKVTSVSGTTINISMPTTAAISKAGAVFGYLVIPNLAINHTVSSATNSRASTIQNVTVNSGGNLTIGIASTTGNDFVCNTMNVNNGGNLGTTNYSGAAQTNTIEINGGEGGTCFTNNGTVDFTTTTGGNSVTNIVFTVPGNTAMTGSGTTNFNKITMNMAGVQTNTLDIQSVFSMLAATTAPTLTLTSGTLKISGASTITPFGGNGTSSANAVQLLAGLYINNASATLNWGTATNDGSGLQVRGALTIANGALYVKGRYDANGVGVTTINGGTLEIPAGIGFSNASAALFHIASLHTFIMTGGNINIKSHNAGAYANPDYYNVSTLLSVTGGTVTFSDAPVIYSNCAKFYNLTVQNGGGSGTTLTRANGTSTILNNLTVGAGSTLENGTQAFLPNFSINGNTTSGSNLVPLQSGANVVFGQYLQGTGIPANTTVTSITQTQTTGFVTSGSNQVTGVLTNTGYVAGNMIAGNGIPAGTTISSITGTGPYTLTLSGNAGASSTNAEVLIINPVITMSNAASSTNAAGQVNFYNATAFTNTGSGTINIQSTSNPAYPVNTTWTSTVNMNGSAGSQNFLTGIYTNVIINNTFSTPVVNMQNGGTNLVTGVAYNGASIINGALTLTNSAFTLNGKSLTLAGSVPTRTTGTISAGTGALVFSSSSANNLPSGIFSGNAIGSSLTVNGTGVVTFPADAITVTGTTTIVSGATLAVGATLTTNAAVSCPGTFQLNSSGYAAGTGTWNYGTTGTLAFNVSYGVDNGHVYWPASNGPVNVSVLTGALTLGTTTQTSRTVTGTFQTTAGVTLSNGSVLTLNGTAQINAGGFFAGSPTYGSSSTLKYNQGGGYASRFTMGNEWPASSGPKNLILDNNSWVQLTGDRSLSGNVVLTNGALQSSGAHTLTMSGTTQTFTVSTTTGGAVYGTDNGSGNDLTLAIANGSTTTFTGDATTSADDEKKFLNITVNSTGTLALSRGILCKYGAFTVNGTLQINSNGYVQSTNGVAASYSSGKLIYNNAGSYTSTDKEWPTTNYPTNVTIQNSGTNVALNNSKTVSGNLTISTGATLDLGAYTANRASAGGTLTVAGTLNLGETSGGQTGSNFPTNYSTVTLTGGTVNYNKANGGQTIYASPTYATLAVGNTSGTQTLDANLTVSNLTINTSGSLSVNAGKQLTVNTNMNNSGTLNLLSTSASGTATILTPANLGGTGGTYNVEQYLTTGRNWYVSSPVSTGLSSIFGAVASSTNKLNWRDETNGSSALLSWPQITDNTTQLSVMRGYIANMPTNGKVTFTGGTLNNGNITTGVNGVPALTRTAGQAKEGFNLVGNPYPSYLDWMAAIDVANTGTSNLMTTMWYRTQNPGTYVIPNVTPYYVFDTFNETANTGTNNNGSGAVTGMIPPMQAFWVRVLSGQTTGTLALTNAMRHHESGTNRLKVKSSRNSAQQVLRLQVSNGTNSDEAILLFNANASNGFDNYDSPKMSNGNAAIPEIYTMAGNEILTINGLNSIPVNTELPLGFTTGQTNTFSIKATEISNFDSGTEIILKDNVKNTEQTISNGTTYSFTSDAINTTSRFSIIFRTASVTTGVDNKANEKSGLNVFKNAENHITINCNDGSMQQGIISVYNAIGQKLINTLTTGTSTVINRTFSPGVYTVIVNVAGNKETRKVILD